VLVLPGDVALQPAVAAPTGKSGGLLPLSPVVTPSQRDLDRLAALLNGDRRGQFCVARDAKVHMTNCWHYASVSKHRQYTRSAARSTSNGTILMTSV